MAASVRLEQALILEELYGPGTQLRTTPGIHHPPQSGSNLTTDNHTMLDPSDVRCTSTLTVNSRGGGGGTFAQPLKQHHIRQMSIGVSFSARLRQRAAALRNTLTRAPSISEGRTGRRAEGIRAHPPADGRPAGLDAVVVDYISTKQLIAAALNTLVGGPSKLFEASGSQVKGAIHSLVQRAIDSGDICPDFEPLDLLQALVGVSNVASVPEWPASARRLVQILIAGSRTVKS